MVVTLYYYEELTMKEIGVVLGVEQSRVSQIQASVVLHLRARLSAPRRPSEPRQHPNSPKTVSKEKARQRSEGVIRLGFTKAASTRNLKVVG
jgi:RNA polymerase sigma factor for flagellar operon FliA